MTRRTILSLAAAAMLLASCGPTPPQAPLDAAKRLDDSLGGISSACGKAYQILAFPADGQRDLVTVESSAVSKSRELAKIYAEDPDWIYQGETVRAIVRSAIADLGSCGLRQAAAGLEAATLRG